MSECMGFRAMWQLREVIRPCIHNVLNGTLEGSSARFSTALFFDEDGAFSYEKTFMHPYQGHIYPYSMPR